MPVNLALGHVSNDFLIAALFIYSLSVVAFAGDFAFGRPRRASAAGVQEARERTAALAAGGAAGRWIQAAMTLAAAGVAAHLVAVVTRGLAVHRPPWGNMYEFVTALTCF